MFRKRVLMAFICLLAAFGMGGFNDDIPYILAGVDQITKPSTLSFLNYSLNVSILLLFLFSFLYYMKKWNILANFISMFIFIFWLFLSLLVLNIDTADMYLHIKEERVVFNSIGVFYFFALIVNDYFRRKREKVHET